MTSSVKNLPPLTKHPMTNQLVDRSLIQHSTTTDVRQKDSNSKLKSYTPFHHLSPYSEVKTVNIQKFINERDPIIKRFKKLKNCNVLPLSRSIDKINLIADQAIMNFK